MSKLYSDSEIKEIKKQAVTEYLIEHSEILKNRWIPCTKRLPDKELDNAKKERGEMAVFPVLATVKRKKDKIVSKVFYSDNGGKHFLDTYAENLDVIAWQPLPEVYEESKYSNEFLEKVWEEILS